MTISAIGSSLLLIVVLTFAPAQTPGTVTGTLTVNGKVTKLSYVQAMKAQDWTFGADNKPVLATVIKVFLGDAPFDDLEDNFELSVRAKEGKLHGLEFTCNKEGEPLDGSLHHETEETGVESLFKSKIVLRRKALNDKMISGTVRAAEPMSISPGKLDFNITFNAPFQQEPKPTLEGLSAEESAPGKAVREFIRAAEAKDVAGLKKLVRKEVSQMLEKPEGQEAVLAMLGQSYPAGKQIKIVRVFDFGERAWIEGDSQRQGEDGKPVDETYRIRAIRINGEWKVSPL